MTWFDSDYGYKKKIEIDPAKVDGDETDFPVLVSVTDGDLADTGNGGHVEHSSGWDIIFSDASEATLLHHEIERYVNTSGLLVFWVNIPSLSSTSTTTFYIYYGKAGVGADPSSEDTWDANFISVWHMNDASGGIADSTSNSKDGVEAGDPTYAQTGKIGHCIDLDGTGDYFDIPNDYGIFTAGDFTIEVWVKFDSVTSNDGIVSLKGEANTALQISATPAVRQTYNNGAWQGVDIKANPDTTNWHNYSATYDNDVQMLGYYDGGLANTDNDHGNIAASATDNFIGYMGEAFYMDGYIDETRISDVKRSANWIGTTFNTQSEPSNFMSFGSEEAGALEHAASDSVSISDSITFKYSIPFADDVAIVDAVEYKHEVYLSDDVAITDSVAFKRLLEIADSVAVTDSVAFKHLLNLADTVAVTDSAAYKHMIYLAESIGVTDSITFKYFLYLLESVSVADSLFFKHLISLTDTVSVADSFAAKHSIFILDDISILDDMEADFADACGSIFQLHSDTYRVFLPVPEYGGESGSVNNELVLFDFWLGERDTDTIGINTEPIILGGTIFACGDNKETEMTNIATKLLNIHAMMDAHEKVRITGLNDCVDAYYIIKNFRYRTVRKSPYEYAWQLTLEYVEGL